MKKNGPFRSSLIPHTEMIIKARFVDNKTGKEIQTMLKEQGIDVAISTVLDFIRVRQRRPNPLAIANVLTYLPSEQKLEEPAKTDNKQLAPEDLETIKKLAELPKEEFHKRAANADRRK